MGRANYRKYLEIAFVVLPVLGFLAWKISHLTFRFGDGNAYAYMAQVLLEGGLPYRDFFLADPPFFVLFLVPFKLLFGSFLLGFQYLPVILEIGTAVLWALILKKWNNPLYFLAPLAYLFSFTILAVTDFFTGVQLTVFLAVLALYFWESQKPFLSGLAWALACLTKLYAAPALLGFMLYILLVKKYRQLGWLVLGGAVVTAVVITPFLFLAWPKVFNYLLSHQFSRPPGLDKWYVWKFFVFREWYFLGFGLAGAAVLKRRILLLPLVFSAVFLLVYPDLYYLYLETVFVFLAPLAVSFLGWIWQKGRQGPVYAASAFLAGIFFLAVSFSTYKAVFLNTGRFINSPQVGEAVKNLPNSYPIYGSHEVAPLIALMSGRKIAENYIDTNTQAFASGAQDLQEASSRVADKGVYFIAKVTDLPQYGIKDFGFSGYFSESVFAKTCRRVLGFPSTGNGQDNTIAVYECKN